MVKLDSAGASHPIPSPLVDRSLLSATRPLRLRKVLPVTARDKSREGEAKLLRFACLQDLTVQLDSRGDSGRRGLCARHQPQEQCSGCRLRPQGPQLHPRRVLCWYSQAVLAVSAGCREERKGGSSCSTGGLRAPRDSSHKSTSI